MNPLHTTFNAAAVYHRSPEMARGWSNGHGASVGDTGAGNLPSDRDFAAMRAGYQSSGGVARGEDLALLLEDRQRGDFVSLARLIASGEVFCFEWRSSLWIPMFQFDRDDLSIKPGARQVLSELSTVFDGWTIAVWFAQRNSWLNEQRPVDLLDSNLPLVLQAARADRYIAAG